MTNPRRLDQAPQDQQNNPNSEAAAGAPHIEQFDYGKTPLAEAPLDPLPSHMTPEVTAELKEPAIFRENPIAPPITPKETQPSEQKPRFTRTQKLLAAGAGVLTLGAGAYIFGPRIVADQVNPLSDMPDRPSTSAPEVPGQEGVEQSDVDYSKIDVQTLTVDQFYDDSIYPQEYRIKWANEIIKEREQKAHAELSSILVEHGYPALNPLVEPDINNTGNEISVQHDVINYIASTDPNPDEGKKLLAATGDYELVKNVFDSIGKEPAVTFHRVAINSDNVSLESPVFNKVAVGEYVPNGTPSKILISVNGITNEASQTVERFIGGRYITHDSIGTTDPSWIIHPDQISDK